MTTPRILALSAAAVLAYPCSAHVQNATPFSVWIDALRSHVPGQLDAAAVQVARWTRNDLEPLLGRLVAQPDAFVLARRALVLHTDIAVLHRRLDGYDLPPGDITMTLFQDGTAVGRAAGTIHWDLGRRLIDRLPAGEERVTIARTYYRSVAATLQSWNEDPELTRHLAAGRRVLGPDPPMLLYEGTQQQMYATPRAQRFFDDRRAATTPYRPTGTLPGRPSNEALPPPALPSVSAARVAAEQCFRRALQQDPQLIEARLRLAHVLADRGRTEDAARELTILKDAPLPRLLDYYRALLVGRVARARGDFDGAEAAFHRASTMYRGAQVPWTALSELALARGDRLRSMEALALATNAATDESDPWWAIDRVHVPSAETQLEEMRRAFVR